MSFRDAPVAFPACCPPAGRAVAATDGLRPQQILRRIRYMMPGTYCPGAGRWDMPDRLAWGFPFSWAGTLP